MTVLHSPHAGARADDGLQNTNALMRSDNLARLLDIRRSGGGVQPLPAAALGQQGNSVTGAEVAARYGHLAYYLHSRWLSSVVRLGYIGTPGRGTWLTPSPYAGCLVPYNLGLDTPRDLCLLVDVSSLSTLWGPGMAGRSSDHPDIWRGGGIEFFVPGPIDLAHVKMLVWITPCGDPHQ